MQPNGNQPDYSFLSNGPAQQTGPSKKKRIMIVAGGGTILLLIAIIVSSLLFGGSGDSTQTSLKLAQLHTELLRVSELGKDSARGQAAKNLATTTNLTLLSTSDSIIALANKDQKVASKLLSAGVDAETDKALNEAEQRSQFDDVFIPLLVEEIKEYRLELSKAFESTSSKTAKQTYTEVYESLNKIISASELANQ